MHLLNVTSYTLAYGLDGNSHVMNREMSAYIVARGLRHDVDTTHSTHIRLIIEVQAQYVLILEL